MTFPIITGDGTAGFGNTTTTTSTTQPIASATWPSSGDSQSFMTIATSTTSFTNESSVQSTFGNLIPVRAWHGSGTTSDATQTTFIYPHKSADPSSTNVRLGMNITGTNTYTNSSLQSSVVSGSTGTYYVGPLAAGGWAQQFVINGSTESFNVPCQFIMTISGGVVHSIETDRNVSVTIPNGSLQSWTNKSITAFVNTPL